MVGLYSFLVSVSKNRQLALIYIDRSALVSGGDAPEPKPASHAITIRALYEDYQIIWIRRLYRLVNVEEVQVGGDEIKKRISTFCKRCPQTTK